MILKCFRIVKIKRNRTEKRQLPGTERPVPPGIFRLQKRRDLRSFIPIFLQDLHSKKRPSSSPHNKAEKTRTPYISVICPYTDRVYSSSSFSYISRSRSLNTLNMTFSIRSSFFRKFFTVSTAIFAASSLGK